MLIKYNYILSYWEVFMFSAKERVAVMKKIFEITGFTFNGKIKVVEFDGVSVEYYGKNAVLGCKDKTTLAMALLLLCFHAAFQE